MSDRFTLSFTTFLAWAIAAWSIISGILGIMAWDSDSARFGRNVAQFFGQANSPTVLVIAILQIIAGLVLLVASLGVLKPNLSSLAIILVAAFWLIRGFIALFVERKALKPSSLEWCRDLAWYLILVLAVWQTRQKST